MKIELEMKKDSEFVIITLEEYNRLKTVENRARKLFEEHLKDILKENKN